MKCSMITRHFARLYIIRLKYYSRCDTFDTTWTERIRPTFSKPKSHIAVLKSNTLPQPTLLRNGYFATGR